MKKVMASEEAELPAKTSGKTHNSDRSDVKNATPDFEQIKRAWPAMSAKLRAQILKAIGNSPEQGT